VERLTLNRIRSYRLSPRRLNSLGALGACAGSPGLDGSIDEVAIFNAEVFGSELENYLSRYTRACYGIG